MVFLSAYLFFDTKCEILFFVTATEMDLTWHSQFCQVIAMFTADSKEIPMHMYR